MVPEFFLRQLMRASFGPAGCSTLMSKVFVAHPYLRSSKSLPSKPNLSLLQHSRFNTPTFNTPAFNSQHITRQSTNLGSSRSAFFTYLPADAKLCTDISHSSSIRIHSTHPNPLRHHPVTPKRISRCPLPPTAPSSSPWPPPSTAPARAPSSRRPWKSSAATGPTKSVARLGGGRSTSGGTLRMSVTSSSSCVMRSGGRTLRNNSRSTCTGSRLRSRLGGTCFYPSLCLDVVWMGRAKGVGWRK